MRNNRLRVTSTVRHLTFRQSRHVLMDQRVGNYNTIPTLGTRRRLFNNVRSLLWYIKHRVNKKFTVRHSRRVTRLSANLLHYKIGVRLTRHRLSHHVLGGLCACVIDLTKRTPLFFRVHLEHGVNNVKVI